MPDPKPTQEQQDAHTDAVLLEALLDDDAQRPWSEDEIALQLNSPEEASDSLGRLARAGLIHRLDKFVFASRAALGADALSLEH